VVGHRPSLFINSIGAEVAEITAPSDRFLFRRCLPPIVADKPIKDSAASAAQTRSHRRRMKVSQSRPVQGGS
jgi:hypothetical protein